MMVLHTINKSPFSHSVFADCLNSLAGKQAVLLIEDGVFAALENTNSAKQIAQHPEIEFYALDTDLKARGIEQQLTSNISVINDQGFVKLVTECSTVQSWF